MKIILAIFTLVVLVGCAATNTNPNDPNFDPVAYKRLSFGPDWEPPQTDPVEIAKHPLGSRENPVRSQGPEGQHAYLNRLICTDGLNVEYSRRGSSGDSPYGYKMDIYLVKCQNSEEVHEVFMDLYHPGYVENEAIPGFTLKH